MREKFPNVTLIYFLIVNTHLHEYDSNGKKIFSEEHKKKMALSHKGKRIAGRTKHTLFNDRLNFLIEHMDYHVPVSIIFYFLRRLNLALKTPPAT
jgi:hypothetical protein